MTESVSFWKSLMKWTICILLIGYVGVALAFGLAERNSRVCKSIDLRIEGNTLPDSILRHGVNSQLARYGKKIVGTPIGALNVQNIENYLQQFSNFENVECSIDPEDRLRIYVTPIQPEARVFESNGKSYYINSFGKQIKADAEFFIDVPVLIVGSKCKENPEYALPVMRRVLADKELSSLIGSFKLDGKKDLLLIPRIHGHVVNFGDTTRFEEKKIALLTAYREILPVKGWETYDTISVKFRDQIVASRRNKAVANHGITEEDGEDLEESALQNMEDISSEPQTPQHNG